MFSDELKEGTLHVHLGLEKKLVSQIKKVNTVNDYIQLLKLMYGYYQPLQQRLKPFLGAGGTGNRQSECILDDIKSLDPADNLVMEVCADLPDVKTHAASLGALYVTEGSTLGGRIITKMIAKQLNIATDRGFTFFNAYGDDTEVVWENFKGKLNEPRSNAERKEMMESAKQTFEKFNEWITLYE